MKNRYLFIITFLILATSACKKQDTINDPMAAVTPPAGFLWEMSANTSINISISDDRFGDALHSISVYDADPQTGGHLIARGSAAAGKPFAAQLYLADTLQSLFIKKTAPDLSAMQQQVTIDAGHSVTATLGTVPVPKFRPMEGPDCATGCSRTITTSNSNIEVAENETVCITGNNITVSFTANSKGTVRICGINVTVQNANLNNDSKLIVTATGMAIFGNLNINSGIAFENYGTAIIASSLSPNGPVTNAGTLAIGGDLSVNADGTLTNRGGIAVVGNTTINSNKRNSSSGSITTHHFTINGGAEFTNLCKLTISGDFNLNGKIYNYSLATVAGSTTINGGAELNMHNTAMFTTSNMMLNGEIRGYGTTSLVKVAANTTINGDGRVRNALQYCDANGIETNNAGNSGFTNGAVQACSVYIPANNCNTSGNGIPAVVDTDGDGVADGLDEYPAQATKAFNNYYPSATGNAVLAFEDQWPAKGDYDFNDLVISYRHNIITNAANRVAAISSGFTLLATGGTLHNAFGIQYPLPATSISGVTGATKEAGQANAVLLLFANMRRLMEYGNTMDNEPESAPVAFTTSFEVANGPLLSSFGLGAYNPFIFNNANTATSGRHEIHLPGKAPTSLGSTALFGTKDDNSNAASARYYLTTTGMPWALNIPTAFKYPKENARITNAYKHFTQWANSGGNGYANWYQPNTDNMANNYIHKP